VDHNCNCDSRDIAQDLCGGMSGDFENIYSLFRALKIHTSSSWPIRVRFLHSWEDGGILGDFQNLYSLFRALKIHTSSSWPIRVRFVHVCADGGISGDFQNIYSLFKALNIYTLYISEYRKNSIYSALFRARRIDMGWPWLVGSIKL